MNYEATVIGPVENTDAALGQLVVMGQTVQTDMDTVFDASIDPTSYPGINIGSNVQVSGFLGADGTIDATRLSGDFITRVFEGPYKNLPKWDKELVEGIAAKGKEVNQSYFFYTTCPKCAKAYGKNYVVGVAAIQ